MGWWRQRRKFHTSLLVNCAAIAKLMLNGVSKGSTSQAGRPATERASGALRHKFVASPDAQQL